IVPNDEKAKEKLLRIPRKKDVTFEIEDRTQFSVVVNDDIGVKVVASGQVNELAEHRQGMRDADQIIADAKNNAVKAEAVERAKVLLTLPKYKPYGRLRIWPWYEYRGPNPYLVVTE